VNADYLSRLDPAVQAFVEETEAAAGVPIEVVPDARLNAGGPNRHGTLKVEIEAQSVRLRAPTNGYFPDGGVRHETLHVHRLHVEGVPRLALADAVLMAPEFEASLVRADNALEHLAIVPVELRCHPERREHWEQVMARFWNERMEHAASDLDRRIDACLHWTFLRHVLPGSPVVAVAAAFMSRYQGLRAEADEFAVEAVAVLADKVVLTQLFFDRFPAVPRGQAALEYVNSVIGTRQAPIPGG
jgi:hypothetical protein